MKRKIAAIVAADIANYSRLVAQDEEETIRRLADHRSVFDDLIVQHKGRIFNTAGDAVLSEFESVVEAVRAAVDIQESLRTRNLDLPPERKLQFRIGISIGDVIERDGDLLGDGVNIAARLESLALPGGICVSRSVHEAVANKISVPFLYLGEQRVKNMPQPIDAFQVTLTGTELIPVPAPKRPPRGRLLATVTLGLAALAVAAVVVMSGKVERRLVPSDKPAPGTASPPPASVPAGLAASTPALPKQDPPKPPIQVAEAPKPAIPSPEVPRPAIQAPQVPEPAIPAAEPPTPEVTEPAGPKAPEASPTVAKVPPKPGDTFRDCPGCPEVIVLAAASFQMGSGTTPFDQPVHRVTMDKPFAIGRTEVTFDEWVACLADGDCKFKPDSQGFGEADRPVINVSWFDAKDYVGWLSRKTGKRYRLPSEAEWEYAAHGGTTSVFAWGETVGKKNANCSDCESGGEALRTLPVRSFPPNGLGLYDMAGNAAEWVEDCWNVSYAGAPNDAAAWETGTCNQRVLRGGSFDSGSAYVKPTARFRYDADVRYWGNGFRVVRELP